MNTAHKTARHFAFRRLALLAALTTAIAAVNGSAQAEEGQPWTLGLNGTFTHLGQPGAVAPAAANAYTLGGGITVGKYISDHYEAGLSLGGTTSGNDSGFNSGSANYEVKLNYHINKAFSKYDPFVGILAGAYSSYAAGSWNTDPSAGGTLGLGIGLNDANTIQFQTTYEFRFIANSAQNQFQNMLKVGITFLFL
ncbi:MAG: hypothetical protein WCS99_04680 [Limisphaerales bacterium]